MRIVLHLPGNNQQHAAWLAAALQMITGFRASVDPGSAMHSLPGARARSGKVDDTSRFVVANMLGCHVETVGDLEASMVMTLAERGRPGFPTVGELHLVLQAYPCWRGQKHLVVATYRDLRKRFAKTRHQLRGKGYGFDEDSSTVTVTTL